MALNVHLPHWFPAVGQIPRHPERTIAVCHVHVYLLHITPQESLLLDRAYILFKKNSSRSLFWSILDFWSWKDTLISMLPLVSSWQHVNRSGQLLYFTPQGFSYLCLTVSPQYDLCPHATQPLTNTPTSNSFSPPHGSALQAWRAEGSPSGRTQRSSSEGLYPKPPPDNNLPNSLNIPIN